MYSLLLLILHLIFLFFHEIPKDEEVILFKDDTLEVRNIILDHTIVCSGFVFKEIKHKRKIKKKSWRNLKFLLIKFQN